ncbi:MAG TPA: hypothetical protein VHI52_10530 [Verrucomicrobiae bacterium]|nr:hypothetical protein [Verrucomicrobiae bacterium]
METTDEIALEDHRFFQARISHLERRHPVALLTFLEEKKLTAHLREVTVRAMRALGELTTHGAMRIDQAEELVMWQIVADPMEKSKLPGPMSRRKMRALLTRYQEQLPTLPRTYLSQNETTE